MKIAFYHNLPGGGSVTVMKNWVDFLEKKHEVDIFTICARNSSNWSKLIFRGKEKRVEVKPWKGFILHNVWIYGILRRYHQKLANVIDSRKYDLVIVNHDQFTKSPYLLRYLKTKKIYILHEPPREFYEPYEFHVHNFKELIANIFRRYIKFIDITNTRHANIIVSNSKYSQSRILKVYKRKSILIYPWVDRHLFKRAKGIRRENLILSVGSLSVTKGHDFIVKTLGRVLNRYKLVILGDGEESRVERILAINSHHANVSIVTRHVATKSLISLFSRAKLLCIGSYFEPFGMTSIEAQACGCPVITVNEGGVPETIKPGLSGLVSRRDQNTYLKAVLSILNNFSSFSKQATINARENWSSEVRVIDIENLLLKVIK